ncbi:MAG: MraY family glycosyltransferase [Planctomycetota bacterium]
MIASLIASPFATDTAMGDRVRSLGERIGRLSEEQRTLAEALDAPEVVQTASRLDTFHGYMPVLIVSFVVSLIATPIMRKLAIANGVVDRPNDARKIHRVPVAYLGGVAVYVGIMAGIFLSYVALRAPEDLLLSFHETAHLNVDLLNAPVPISILLGMTIIMLCGLVDDVVGISPRIKIAGQLFAAAALAYEDVGVRLAGGVMAPIGAWIGNQDLTWTWDPGVQIPLLGSGQIEFDLIYWTGAAIIAVFVLGACNASNLIDGLDGLLTGVTSIATIGLLVVALSLAAQDDGPRDTQRVVLCLAVLGACLGFLPHNWNPASIFLGDAGSLLLGFCTIVIVLTLGDTAKTHLVFAGLMIYAIPIIDTILAIVRRKMAGKSISDADDQHLHHMLKRALGVRGAVGAIYAMGCTFAAIGVLLSDSRARVSYALALLFASYIAVLATKAARKAHLEADMQRRLEREPADQSPSEDEAEPAEAQPVANA